MPLPRHPLPPAPIPAGQDWPAVDEAMLASIPARSCPALRAVIRALGWGRAGEWLRDYGGVPVVVPLHRQEALGLTAPELGRLRYALQPHMDAAGRVFLPKPDKLFIRVRDAEIRKARLNKSLTALAREYRLTSRHIQNICREGDDRQESLF